MKELIERLIVAIEDLTSAIRGENEIHYPQEVVEYTAKEKPWTDEERAIVRDNSHLSAREIKERFLPHRLVSGIEYIKSPPKHKKWTKEEEAILADYAEFNTLTLTDELKSMLPNRTEGAIIARLKKNYGIV